MRGSLPPHRPRLALMSQGSLRGNGTWGFGRYKFQHEPIFYAHVAGQKDLWYGDKSQSTLWQENKPARRSWGR
jgi:hypothetical protein